jgi:CubicO group peptidase (beta-lactamase class C family)
MRFAYSSAETQVLGLVLRRATGRTVAEYLEQKIWQPIGAEADATWLIDNAGQEATFGGLSVMVNTSVHEQPVDIPALEEMWALWWAIVKRFGGRNSSAGSGPVGQALRRTETPDRSAPM